MELYPDASLVLVLFFVSCLFDKIMARLTQIIETIIKYEPKLDLEVKS